MTRAQFDALMAYMDARMDEQIAMRSGYDALNESVRTSLLRRELEHSGIVKDGEG